jgi:hypothetical protein
MIKRAVVGRLSLLSVFLAAIMVAGTAFVIGSVQVPWPAKAVNAPNPPTPQPGPPDNQAFKDGCTRTPADLIAGTSPEWAYIYNTPANQPPPPPRWVQGTVVSGDSHFQAVHVAGDDLPTGHDAYDFNFNVLPDPQFMYLVGGHPATNTSPATGNYAGQGEDTARLHTEWEDTAIPKFAWPEPNDRVTQLGSWIWDCGHWGTPTEIFSPDYLLPKLGQPCMGSIISVGPILDPAQCIISGEGTEFHPYRALWDERAQSNSPFGESQADLFISTEATRAGIEANCAHKNPPLVAGTSSLAFKACLSSDPNWQDVSGDYSYFLAAPAQTLGGAQLTFRAVNHGSSGAPAPTLTPAVQGGKPGVQVTFHLSTAPPSASLPNGQQLKMGYTVYAGWSQIPVASVPTHVRVTFNNLQTHRAMDPGCTGGAPVPNCQAESLRTNQLTTAPGEWNIFMDVSGNWQQWGNGEFDANDGSNFAGTQTADIYVPPGKGWRLYAAGRECDLGGLAAVTGVTGTMKDCPGDKTDIADGNDVPGTILDSYASATAFTGTKTSDAQTHAADPTSTCPDAPLNPNGCYSITYTVQVVDDGGSRTHPPGVCHEGDGEGHISGKHGGEASFHADNDEDTCHETTDTDDEHADTANHVDSNDPQSGMDFHSTNVSAVSFDDGAHTMTAKGEGLNNGQPVTFVAVTTQNLAPLPSTFSLILSDGYTNAGTLLDGIVTLQ